MNFAASFMGLRNWLESQSIDHKELTVVLRFKSKSAALAFESALSDSYAHSYPEIGRLRRPSGLTSTMRVAGLEVRVETPFDQ